MNVFYLERDIHKCAESHCDKHVVKMPVEYAQLLSTAHRVLDGTAYYDTTGKRTVMRWRHPGKWLDQTLYQASHVLHPCAVWCRESIDNYVYLYELFCAVSEEYTHRYGRVHGSYEKLKDDLFMAPDNISYANETPMPQCMPDEYKCDDPIEAYRSYYRGAKRGFASWKNRPMPEWFAASHV